jgi:hypothetical protein
VDQATPTEEIRLATSPDDSVPPRDSRATRHGPGTDIAPYIPAPRRTRVSTRTTVLAVLGTGLVLVTLLIAGVMLLLHLLSGGIGVPAPQDAPGSISADVKPGDCMKEGQYSDYKMVACTDATARWRVTRRFPDMSNSDFEAKMANGGDICQDGESTYGQFNNDAKGIVLCLAKISTPTAPTATT